MTGPEIDLMRKRLADFCHRLYKRDLVGGTEGNASVKIDLDKIMITPTGSNLGYIEPEDPVIITMDGKIWDNGRAPSSEYGMHLGIYKNRWDIGAICHAHPIAATACATAGIPLDQPVLPEIISTFGTIPIVEYGAPGTPELFDKMVGLVESHDAFLLESHGVVTLGIDLNEAFNRLEMVERCARIIITANLIGGVRQLPDDLINKLAGIDYSESQNKIGFDGED